jgi:hypothetical protein
MKVISRIITWVCLLIATIPIVGCTSRLNKNFGYKAVEYKFNGLRIGAKLIGTFISQKKVTIRGTPYELFIWFESDSEISGDITISGIKIYSVSNDSVVYRNTDKLSSSFNKDSDGKKYSAYFSLDKIDIEYIQYNLDLKFEFKSADREFNDEITLSFNTDYSESKSNDFWDKIQSV